MAAFSIVSHMKGILRHKGFTIADYPFTADETQQTLKAVLDSCNILGGFIATQGELCDCYINVALPHYCETNNGKDTILLKVDMAGILADRAAAIAQEGGAT